MEHLDHTREGPGVFTWCFLPRDARWRRRDPWGDRLLITVGKTFRATDMQEMRRRHLDAWERPLDALRHAAGLVACRVLFTGTIEREGYPRYYIIHDGNRVTTRRGMIRYLPATYEGIGRIERLYASEFRALWAVDATLVVHHFACDLAERALQMEQAAGREPDNRAWAMIPAYRAWLTGDMSDGEAKATWSGLEAAMTEHWLRCPPDPHGRPMNEIEAYALAEWGAHGNMLRTVQYATEPVPLSQGRSVQKIKRAIGWALVGPSRAHGKTQEERIAIRSAQTEAINAEFERRLTDAGQSA